jgi:hypothetical protein
LIAVELNGAVPQGFGGPAGIPREQVLALRTSTNKAELVAAIEKAFEHTKAQVAAANSLPTDAPENVHTGRKEPT